MYKKRLVLSVAILISSSFSIADTMLEFKNKKIGYELKYPSSFSISTGIPDESRPADQSRFAEFMRKKCNEGSEVCIFNFDQVFPNENMKSLVEFKSKLNFQSGYDTNDKSYYVVEWKIDGKKYKFLVQNIQIKKENKTQFRVSNYFICDERVGFKFELNWLYNGNFSDFVKGGQEKDFSKIVPIEMQSVIQSFKCPSKDSLDKFLKNTKF